MNRLWFVVGSGLAIMLLVLAACVQEIEREGTKAPPSTIPGVSPTPSPSPVPTAAATPTPTVTAPPTTTPAPSPPTQPQLSLQVRAPVDGSHVRGDAVVVHGIATPGATVAINGQATAVDREGRFSSETRISPGTNAIEVVATDSKGNRKSSRLTVTSLALPPQPFLLIITEPQDQSIISERNLRLSGRTGPEAIASVNGVSVTVDTLGFFSTTVTLEPGPNIIDVVATNNDGRVLSAVIAVIFRP